MPHTEVIFSATGILFDVMKAYLIYIRQLALSVSLWSLPSTKKWFQCSSSSTNCWKCKPHSSKAKEERKIRNVRAERTPFISLLLHFSDSVCLIQKHEKQKNQERLYDPIREQHLTREA